MEKSFRRRIKKIVLIKKSTELKSNTAKKG